MLTLPTMRRLHRPAVNTASLIIGLAAGMVTLRVFYELIVPSLRGFDGDPQRAIMYWLHRWYFVPRGIRLSENDRQACMDLIAYLPAVLFIPPAMLAFFFARRRLRWEWLARPEKWRPYCPYCRYNLTGNSSGVCPECGEAVPWSSALPPPMEETVSDAQHEGEHHSSPQARDRRV